jgi:hypothetical protein
MSVSKLEIETQWSLDDVLDAHMALDVWDELEFKASQPSK